MVAEFVKRIMRWRRLSGMRRIGTVFISIGFLMFSLLFGPIIRKRLSYDVATRYPILSQKLHHTRNSLNMEAPVSSEFGLVIPKLNINVPVVAEVDSDVPHFYFQKLHDGVAHFKGTAKPNERGNTVIYGHSSSISGVESSPYDFVFVLLDKLTKGDIIELYWHNQPLQYQVKQVVVKDAQAFELLDQTVGAPTVTLLTCWPPGTDLKRLAVVAEQL